MAHRLRTSTPPFPLRIARLSLAVVLFATANPAFAQDPAAGKATNSGTTTTGSDLGAPSPVQDRFMTLQDMLERGRVWQDVKYIRGWNNYCAKNPERGGCEVILRRYGHRPVIGVVLAPDETQGVRIAGVTPDGPAARAGIKAGDRLIGINGSEIEGSTAESRVENARRILLGFRSKDTVRLRYERDDLSSSVAVKPKLDKRLMILANDGRILRPGANVTINRDTQRRVDIQADGLGLQLLDDKTPITGLPISGLPVDGQGSAVLVAGVSPTRNLLIDPECGDSSECSPLRLSEAFRWNGFNLAAVDPQLGRYFGATEGVLVLSSTPYLPELMAGDVIRKIDGLAVATPRAVMDALRSKPAQSVVEFELIRDRNKTNARIKLPDALAVIPAQPEQYADPSGNRPPQMPAPKVGSRIRR
jgi:S1-C subfamily serine protease